MEYGTGRNPSRYGCRSQLYWTLLDEVIFSELRDADLPISQALKEAIVWEVLGDALTYENATEEERAGVSQLVREKL